MAIRNVESLHFLGPQKQLGRSPEPSQAKGPDTESPTIVEENDQDGKHNINMGLLSLKKMDRGTSRNVGITGSLSARNQEVGTDFEREPSKAVAATFAGISNNL